MTIVPLVAFFRFIISSPLRTSLSVDFTRQDLQWRSQGGAQGGAQGARAPPLRWSVYAVNGSGQQAATA